MGVNHPIRLLLLELEFGHLLVFPHLPGVVNI